MSTTPAAPFRFFVLTFVLSLPFWALGSLAARDILPDLPISALMVICPALAAVMLIWRAGGAGAVKRFLSGAIDPRGMRLWVWLTALATMPLAMLLSALWLTATGQYLPVPQIALGQTLALFALFFLAATLEEVGWAGYATGPLARRHGLIRAGLIIGVVTLLWHLIPLLQTGRAWDWIAWWALGTMARRLILTWLYIRGGQRVFAASLFHAMSNLSWMLFPVMGSHYDPVSVAVILVGMAIGALMLAHRKPR